MSHGHLREAPAQQQRDQRANAIAQQDRGAREADGETAAEEQSGADGTADGDHAHAARAE